MEKLKSRKLWVAIVSALLIVLNQGLGLNIPADSVLSLAGVIMAYIFGQAYVDGKQSVLQIKHISEEKPQETIEQPPEVEQQAIEQPIQPKDEVLTKINAIQNELDQLKQVTTLN